MMLPMITMASIWSIWSVPPSVGKASRSLSCRLWTSNNPVAFGAAVVARRVVRGARVSMRRLSHRCDDEERQVSRQEMDRAVRKRVDDGADDG